MDRFPTVGLTTQVQRDRLKAFSALRTPSGFSIVDRIICSWDDACQEVKWKSTGSSEAPGIKSDQRGWNAFL